MSKPLTASQIAEYARVLGVAHGASAAEVKTAWHEAARTLHPDLTGGQTDREMAQVNAAAEALKNGVPKAAARASRAAASAHATVRPLQRRYKIGDDIRDPLLRDALAKLQDIGAWTPGRLHKMRQARFAPRSGTLHCPPHIHIPSHILVDRDGDIGLIFPRNLRKGMNFIVAPHLYLEPDGMLIIGPSDDFKIFEKNREPKGAARATVRFSDDLLHDFPDVSYLGSFN